MKNLFVFILLSFLCFSMDGTEYIIVDLTNGKISELDATPADLLTSKDYETDKMVLRRIKAGSFMMLVSHRFSYN